VVRGELGPLDCECQQQLWCGMRHRAVDTKVPGCHSDATRYFLDLYSLLASTIRRYSTRFIGQKTALNLGGNRANCSYLNISVERPLRQVPSGLLSPRSGIVNFNHSFISRMPNGASSTSRIVSVDRRFPVRIIEDNVELGSLLLVYEENRDSESRSRVGISDQKRQSVKSFNKNMEMKEVSN
jgi:hypothetical protein